MQLGSSRMDRRAPGQGGRWGWRADNPGQAWALSLSAWSLDSLEERWL